MADVETLINGEIDLLEKVRGVIQDKLKPHADIEDQYVLAIYSMVSDRIKTEMLMGSQSKDFKEMFNPLEEEEVEIKKDEKIDVT